MQLAGALCGENAKVRDAASKTHKKQRLVDSNSLERKFFLEIVNLYSFVHELFIVQYRGEVSQIFRCIS